MKSKIGFVILTAVTAANCASAQAQADTDSKEFAVIGNVPSLCSAGTLVGNNGTFDLGVLINTTTGLLRDDLAAPDKTLSGAYCSTRSTIAIAATTLSAENYTATPPAGFARSVDYTATASGWTTAPASFDTAAASNPAASQVRQGAFTGDIIVGIDGFATVGGQSQRLVADTSYRGLVTVTLTAAE